MYRVKIYNNNESTTIQEPLADDVRLLSGSLKKGINTFSSYEFSMLPNNPGLSKIKNRQTLINIVDSLSGKEIFWGQVLSPTDSMDSDGSFNYEYMCADGLSFLQDSIQDYYKAQNMTPEAFFRHLIDVHNSKMIESHKKFTVGTVNVTNSTDNVYRYVDETATTWATIQDKLVSRLGGEIVFRRVSGINYVDYLVEGGKTSDTTIELTKNMLSFSRNIDPTEVITVFKPRGARPEGVTGGDYNAAEPRLTIASVNDGKDYLLASQALINEFGYVEGSIAYDDVTVASTLKLRGQQFLASQKAALVKYTVNAVDLSLLGLDIDRFEVMNRYRTKNHVFGVDEYLRVVGMTIDTTNPQVSNLTFGDKQKTLSEYQSDANKRTKSLTEIQNNVTNLSNNYGAVTQQLENLSGDITVIVNELEQGDLSGIRQQLIDLQQDIDNLVIPVYQLASSTNDGLFSKELYMKLMAIQLVTQQIDGLMSKEDKIFLDSLKPIV